MVTFVSIYICVLFKQDTQGHGVSDVGTSHFCVISRYIQSGRYTINPLLKYLNCFYRTQIEFSRLQRIHIFCFLLTISSSFVVGYKCLLD